MRELAISSKATMRNLTKFWIAPPADPQDLMEKWQDSERLEEAISMLTPRKRQAVIGFFFTDKTLNEIGKEMGVTGSRVRQIKETAIRHLRVNLYKNMNMETS